MALNRYDSSCPSNYHTACGGGKHRWKQHQLVGVHKPLTTNLDSSNDKDMNETMNEKKKFLRFTATIFYVQYTLCIKLG